MSAQDSWERRLAAQARWDKQHTVRVGLKLNANTDADIISWLQRQQSRQGSIKAAIRAAIEHEKR